MRTIAGGEALLSPAITKRVIQHFTRLHRQAPPKAVDTLTTREMEVFRLITQGLSNAEIGQELFISDTTVKTHVTRLLQKLDLRDRAQAIVLAYQTGLFDASDRRPAGQPRQPHADPVCRPSSRASSYLSRTPQVIGWSGSKRDLTTTRSRRRVPSVEACTQPRKEQRA